MRFYLRITTIIFLLMLASTTYAQSNPLDEPIPISYGDVVTGTISDDQPEVRYSFQAEAGDVITISMIAMDDGSFNRLDSYLLLLDEIGNEIAYDDDSGGSLNAFLGPQSLGAGTYTIVATRCCGGSGGSFGDYQLALNLSDAPSLLVGEPITFELNTNNPVGFGFLNADTTDAEYVQAVVTIISGEGNFYGGAQGPIGQHYYGQWYPNNTFIIGPVPMDIANGAYYFNLTSTWGSRSDPYGRDSGQLPVTVQMMIEPIEPQPIERGQDVIGSLTLDTPLTYYSFPAEIGDSLRIEAEELPESTASIEMILFDGLTEYYAGDSTAYRADSRFIIDPVIVRYGIQQLVRVSFVSSIEVPETGSTADYRFVVAESETPVLSVGDTIVGEVQTTGTADQIYLLQGTAGQTITLTLTSTSEDMSASMDFSTPQIMGGAPLFSVYSTGGGTSSYTLTLPIDARYLIRVYNGRSDTMGPLAGSFSLSIE